MKKYLVFGLIVSFLFPYFVYAYDFSMKDSSIVESATAKIEKIIATRGESIRNQVIALLRKATVTYNSNARMKTIIEKTIENIQIKDLSLGNLFGEENTTVAIVQPQQPDQKNGKGTLRKENEARENRNVVTVSTVKSENKTPVCTTVYDTVTGASGTQTQVPRQSCTPSTTMTNIPPTIKSCYIQNGEGQEMNGICVVKSCSSGYINYGTNCTKQYDTVNNTTQPIKTTCSYENDPDKIRMEKILKEDRDMIEKYKKSKNDLIINVAGAVRVQMLNAGHSSVGISNDTLLELSGNKQAGEFIAEFNRRIALLNEQIAENQKILDEYLPLLKKECNYQGDISRKSEVPSIICQNSEHKEGDVCISNSKSCSVSNGVGQQVWNGSMWGSCAISSCNTGYNLSNGSCIVNPVTCPSNQHPENNVCVYSDRFCDIPNGVGQQDWNFNQNSWNSCSIFTCNEGYEDKNGSCILKEIQIIPIVTGSSPIANNYPGCNTSDIKIGTQTWAACNVGANSPSEYGNYYQWGRNDTGWDQGWNSDNWGPGGQGPCAIGYHVPTMSEFETAQSLLKTTYGSNIERFLVMSLAGTYGYYDNLPNGIGMVRWYWTSTGWSKQLHPNFVFFDGLSGNGLNGTSWGATRGSVRCIKN